MNGTTPPSQDRSPGGGHVIRNVFHLGIGQVISTALGFVLTAALGRALGPSDFGIFYIVATIYGFAGILIDWGQSTYVIRDTARGRADQAEFIGAALVIRIVGNFCAGAVGAGVAWALGYDQLTIFLVALVALVSFPGTLATLFGYFFRGRDRMDVDVLIALVGKALGVAAILLALGFGAGLVEIVAVSVVGSIGSFILSLYFIRRFGFQISLPRLDLVRQLVWVGAPIALMSFSMGMQPFVDVALLSALTAPAVVGWLGAARAILGIFMAPAAILASASFPELSRSAHAAEDLRRILSASSRVSLAAGAGAASVLFIFADFGVGLTYGHGKFDQAAVLLQVTAIVLPLLFLNFLVANAVFAVGRMVAIAIIKVALVAAGSVLGWFAISYCQSHFGNGAIGTIVSFGVMETIMVPALLRLLPREAVDRGILWHLARAYVTFGSVLLLIAFLPALPVWAAVPVVGVTFVAVALATRLLVASDIVKVFEVIRSSISGRRQQGA